MRKKLKGNGAAGVPLATASTDSCPGGGDGDGDGGVQE